MMGSSFESILFPSGAPPGGPGEELPDLFRDLQLDQIVARSAAAFREHDLEPIFRAALDEPDDIAYRQEIFRDLADQNLLDCLVSFSRRMHSMRTESTLAEQARHRYESERWFVSAVHNYCTAVRQLRDGLEALELRSRGLRAFRRLLGTYAASEAIETLAGEVDELTSALAAIRFSLRMNGASITVRRFAGEVDFGEKISALFERFTPARPEPGSAPAAEQPGSMDHVQARIVERVALLYPEVFRTLEAFPAAHADYLDATIVRFDREIQFYLAYHGLMDTLGTKGLSFCLPEFSATAPEVAVQDGFDLALALKQVAEGRPIVTNDFRVQHPECVLVITGPNHGGKTTFARMFGQLHWLARLGCPVPGTKARLAHCDRLFTHFGRAEDMRSGRGRLHEELVRIRWILDQATSRSIIILNEIFAATTVSDAVLLGSRVIGEISRRNIFAVCVTFLDELASLNEQTVSMVATTSASDPSVRTFRIERRPADGLAYALLLAAKYRVTYDWLLRRVEP